jgi:hypothetical protein
MKTLTNLLGYFYLQKLIMFSTSLFSYKKNLQFQLNQDCICEKNAMPPHSTYDPWGGANFAPGL